MMLFVICGQCKKEVETRRTLDICQFTHWTCPICGAVNQPVGQNITEEAVVTELEEPVVVEEIVVEIAEINPENMEGNIL